MSHEASDAASRDAASRDAASAPVWAVVAGGGTAGHVLPGLCIAQEIVRRGTPSDQVHFVGSERGVEARLVPEAGFTLTTLAGRGLQRRVTPANLAAAAGLAKAFLASFALLRRRRPAVVVGLGGYASAACGAAAVLLRIPLVIAEQNAVAGLVNRVLSRFAAASACAFAETGLRREHWTGNPVRPEILAVHRGAERSAAREALGVDAARRLVSVFGGSLGARRVNDSVLEALACWQDRDDLHIRHICGSRDFADVAADERTRSSGDALAYDLVEYERDMATVYAASDLVVARAGATSVAEIAVTGVPAVLVPLPNAPGDHQSANARHLERVGAAVMIPDAQLDGARLASELDALLAAPQRLADMERSGMPVARRDAAAAIVDLVELHARRPISP